MKPTVFLGGGRITAALIAGLRLAKYRIPIVVHDRHPEKLRQLRKKYKVGVEADLQCAVDSAGLLIVAVRPASVATLLQEIGAINRPLLAVSLAAGIPLAKLKARLGPPVRWARAMPSPVCRTGQGLTGLAFPKRIPVADRQRVREFFANVGNIIEVPEPQFDIFTATYSPSHGYHAVATLARAAEKMGLDHRVALIAAAHGLAGGIREGEILLDELIKEAATPGGIAEAAMTAMDKGQYQRLVQKALRAAVARARANANAK